MTAAADSQKSRICDILPSETGGRKGDEAQNIRWGLFVSGFAARILPRASQIAVGFATEAEVGDEFAVKIGRVMAI